MAESNIIDLGKLVDLNHFQNPNVQGISNVNLPEISCGNYVLIGVYCQSTDGMGVSEVNVLFIHQVMVSLRLDVKDYCEPGSKVNALPLATLWLSLVIMNVLQLHPFFILDSINPLDV